MSKRIRENGEGSIYITIRNGKKYYRAQVTMGFDSNGNQIRKTYASYNKGDVLRELKAMQREADMGILLQNEVNRFGDFFLNWVENYKKIEVTSSTYKKYLTNYKLRIKDTPLARKKLEDIKSLDIQRHITLLMDKGDSVKIIRRVISQIKQCLEYAKLENYIFINPADNVRLPQDKAIKESYQVLSIEEQNALIEALDMKSPRDMIIYLALATGMRKGELLALTWDDISPDKEISITKQVSTHYKADDDFNMKHIRKVSDLKTKSSVRTIPIPPNVYRELMIYKQHEFEYKMAIRNEYIDNNLVFHNGNGDFMSHNMPLRRMKQLCDQLGIKDKQFHSLRHTYATRLFESGVEPKTVQTLLGHSQIATTLDIYTHVLEPQKKSAINKINALF